MFIINRISTLTLLFFFSTSLAVAQFPGAGRGGAQNMNMGHFYGKIIDATTNKPIEAASVQLYQTKLDSATKKRKEVIVAGMLTTKKGEFSLENLAVLTSYKLKITAIGYKDIEQKAFFDMNSGGGKPGDYTSMMNAVDKDLGNIKLETDAKQMAGVTVTASRPLLTMSIDRKVFNVEKNLTSVGGTAVDVMKNVPSLNVDIDGNVTMRNASPQIFVDGRPTTMTLDQIPADAISTVEIITNPSAKFDASGGGSGILNIVLKKNRKAGYNGSVRAGIDSRGKPSAGGDFNLKQGKVNFFGSGQLGFRKSISTVSTNRTDFLGHDSTAHQVQSNGPVGKGVFGYGRLGMDYLVDNRNTFTIGGNMSKGQFKNSDIIYTDMDTVLGNQHNYSFSNRGSNSTNNFENYGSTLSYKHNFAKANKDISADLNYNYSKNDNINDLNTQYFDQNRSARSPLLYQRSQGGGTTKFFTAQTDYSDPISSTMKLETGARIAIRDFTSFNNNFFRNSNGDYISMPLLNNAYQFKDQVLAAYMTLSQQLKRFSYNIGLRVESSKYDGTLTSKGESFSNSYPFSLFPSAFATYKLTEKQDLQINYSRKVNRPNFYQLIPFVDYTDSLNLNIGNPNLVPEFTHLIELSYQNQFSNGHSILGTVYFKNTNNLITRYQYRDKSPYKLDSVLYSTYANASASYTIGLELTAKDKITDWWDITTNINFFQAQLKAGNLASGEDSKQFSWYGKLNNSFKLPANFSIQLSGNYQAKTLLAQNNGGGGGGGRGPGGGGGGMMFGGGGNTTTSQGYINPSGEVEMAIKKDFLKNNAASLTLQFSDIFRTRVNSTHSESAYFIQDYSRLRDPQVIRLNFNWRFGKIDASLFKRKNLKSEMENMQNSIPGGN